MLVIDRIEVVGFDELQEVRKFDRDAAVMLEKDAQAGNEVVDVGNMGQNIVAHDEIGLPPV